MPPDFARAVNALRHPERHGLERHLRAQLTPCHCEHPLGSRFLVTNDASRDMPAGTIKLVITPSQQRAALSVLDEQIDVDSGREAADQQK